MIAVKIVKGVQSHFVRRAPEWLLAGHIGVLGFQLIRTDQTFRTGAAYRVIAHFVSEQTWGGVALAISSFWLVALILNGSFAWFARWSRWVRSMSAFAVSGFWSASALGIWEATHFSSAFVNNAFPAVAAFTVSLITAHEVGAADKRAIHAATRTE